MIDLEGLKKKIDTYIQERIDYLLMRRFEAIIEEKLFPMAQAYIEEQLDRKLDHLLREALEESLNSLAREFEVDFEVPDYEPGTSSPPSFSDDNESDLNIPYASIEDGSDGGDVSPDEEGDERPDESDFEGDLTEEYEVREVVGVSPKSLRLLAFLQFYRQKHGGEAIPPSNQIYKHLGYESLTISRLYTELEEEGWIDREKGGSDRKIDILQPLPDPAKYVSNPYQ